MNRQILRLALPNIISNITVPLLGMADLAIAGRTGAATLTIAAMSVGTGIFGMIYWNCAFLRMGASGLTAQAYGARRLDVCADMLLRSTVVALALAALLLALQRPVWDVSAAIIGGSDSIRALAQAYFDVRIWAAPATVWLMALQGWFIGMQDSDTPMAVALLSNVVNIAASYWLAIGCQMGITGIAMGTVAAQYAGLAVSLGVVAVRYRSCVRLASVRRSLNPQALTVFFNINRDIFLRTLCMVIAYTFFTAVSARMGDITLAVNTLLMQLFTLFSYMTDGLAYAAEALVGRFIGERDRARLTLCMRRLLMWGAVVALAYVVVYVGLWRSILALFNPEPEVLEAAGRYVGWIVAVPIVGFAPFMFDGFLIGAAQTTVMRNTVFWATVIYLTTFFALHAGLGMGNTSIWIAFIVFLAGRGLLLWRCTRGLRTITDMV